MSDDGRGTGPRLLRWLAAGALAVGLLSAAPPVRQDERPAGPDEWGFRPADGATTRRNPPSFSWRPQAGAATYELAVARPGESEAEYAVGGLEWSVHCPPVTLPAGEWSWRFRAVASDGTPGAWSRARAFRVPDDAAAFTLPPRDELLARIPAEHPRLFLRPEDLPALRDAVAGPLRERFEALRARCDALVAAPPETTEPLEYTADMPRKSEAWRERWWGNRRATIRVLESAATLAFTWRVTGDEEYGALARHLLLEAADWDPKGATGYRYNDEAGMPYAYHFSRAYTFLHPLLDQAEREACRAVMRVRGRELYAHLAPRHLWRPYSSHSNRAWHFLGEVGIAFHGELEEADDWVWFAANVFANVYPVWSDADGGWHEGSAYWTSYLSRFTWWADVQRAALGLDAYALPFFANAGDFALYTAPPGSAFGGFGDLAANRGAEGMRELMTLFAVQAGNPYWQDWVERAGGPKAGAGYVGLLRAARSTPGRESLAELPTSKRFHGTGVAALNTSLVSADEDVQVLFKSSPFGSRSHGYEAQNAFLLRAFGERVFLRTGHRDVYGSAHHRHWMWETESVNSVLVDGRGQEPHSARAVGRITGFHTEPGVHWVEGEAGAAYAGRVESFRRGVLLLEPDLVVVHDRLVVPEPAVFEWLLHAGVPFALEPSVAAVEGEAAAARVEFLVPEDLELSQTDAFDPPPRERVQLVQHHLEARTEPLDEALFLTVIRPHRSGTSAPARTVKLPEGPGGERRFRAPLDGHTVELALRSDGTLTASVRDADGAEVRALDTRAWRDAP